MLPTKSRNMRGKRTKINTGLAEPWQHFGQNVCKRREELGMTQKSASDIAKMSRVHWARIERGQATKRSALFQIAEALNLPPATILGWAGFKFEDGVNGTVETTLTPLFDYKGISASERTKLRPLLEMLDREIERLQKMHG